METNSNTERAPRPVAAKEDFGSESSLRASDSRYGQPRRITLRKKGKMMSAEHGGLDRFDTRKG